MTRRLYCATVVSAVLLSTPSVLAATFDYPPETYVAGWQTNPPYQRDISWDYQTNPQGAPSASGAPGAIYGGTLDSSLKGGDFVTFGGDTSWSPGVDVTGDVGQIGIDNRTGQNPKNGTFKKDIQNTAIANPYKRVHVEATYLKTIGQTAIINFGLPDGATALPGSEVQRVAEELGNGLERVKVTNDFTFSPNPAAETIKWTYSVPVGNVFLIEKVHIATECVTPEPVSISVLLMGLGLLSLTRPRRSLY